MKRKIMVALCLMAVIITVGIANKDWKIFQMENKHQVNAIVDDKEYTIYNEDEAEIIETVKKDEINKDAANLMKIYLEDDLVYREYPYGCKLQGGCEIVIKKESIIDKIGDSKKIIIIRNSEVYKEIDPNNNTNDIKFEIDRDGNYCFFIIDENGELVDITETGIIEVYFLSSNGLLLYN